jgi:phage terminase large subunit-like protein
VADLGLARADALDERANAYLRLIENRWVTTESEFVPTEWFDACVDRTLRPEVVEPSLPVWVGVDASVRRDSTAIAAVAWDGEDKRARLAWHQVFQPSAADPLDFEAAVEDTLLQLRRHFLVREVRYDPFQMVAVAQRLARSGLPMLEFPQTSANLTEASSNLYELFKGRNLRLYPDAGLRLAVQRSVAIETARGWRIAKEKAAHKIDVVVALAQACLGAVRGGQRPEIPLVW